MVQTVETFQFQKEVTGSNSAPVKFTCIDDSEQFENYYVKYIHSEEEFDCLVYEIVCQRLARQLLIKTPEIAIVNVIEGAFDQNQLIRNEHYFVPGISAFGSKAVFGTNLLGSYNSIPDKHTFNLYANPFDLIKIGIFDLLVDNRDRTEDNFNILKTQEAPIQLYAFDHFFCFGGRQNLGKLEPTSSLNIGHTILRSKFCAQMFYFVPLKEIGNNLKIIFTIFLRMLHTW